MNRTEYLEWCKKRALEHVEAGELTNAYSSMVSDLTNRPETETHAGIALGMMLMMSGKLNTPAEMRNFIEGFN